jgi:hypothetical protein
MAVSGTGVPGGNGSIKFSNGANLAGISPGGINGGISINHK